MLARSSDLLQGAQTSQPTVQPSSFGWRHGFTRELVKQLVNVETLGRLTERRTFVRGETNDACSTIDPRATRTE